MNGHRLVKALRRANALAMETTAPDDVLAATADTVERLCDRLAEHPGPRIDAERLGLEETSFIQGRANPLAPPAHYAIVARRLSGTVTLCTPHQSRPGFAHGGMVAALFDDMLGALQLSGEIRGPTAQLSVRYVRPVPVNTPLDLEARIDGIEGRKIRASGTIAHGEQVCAEGEALFIAQRRD